jgi:dTDP-4-amino-4,6-dideoxygalactose transaminase
MTARVRQVPLLDLQQQHRLIRDDLQSALTRVLDSGRFILGEDVKVFEGELASYLGASHAIGCASGSDALSLALMAIGVSHEDTVLTTPFTFFATAGEISRVGATPVFVDIDPITFNIDPDRLAEALRSHPRPAAILPVHLFGGCADMDPILDLAEKYGCRVIEDGAQSIGAEYKGRKAQSLADMGCLSFFPTKNLGAMGDAGMVLTNNSELASRLVALRQHGSNKRYYHDLIGINSRLDTLQAAVLRVKLPYLDSWSDARIRNAGMYRELLRDIEGVRVPNPADYQTRHVYNQFVIRAASRNELKVYLNDQGIGAEIYYPVPLHLQACYKFLGHSKGDFPESEKAAEEVLALPIHEGLGQTDIEYVSHCIRAFYA